MHTSINIRCSQPEDLEELSKTMEDAFKHDVDLYGEAPYGQEPEAEIIREMTEQRCYTFLSNNTIVGGMYLKDVGAGEFRLKRIWIDCLHQNAGIGSIVLKEIEVMRTGIRKITLDTPYKSYRNHHFYEKHGFKKIGERKIEQGDMANLDSDFTLYEYEKLFGS